MIFQCANQLDYQTWGTHRSEDRNLASINTPSSKWRSGSVVGPYLTFCLLRAGTIIPVGPRRSSHRGRTTPHSAFASVTPGLLDRHPPTRRFLFFIGLTVEFEGAFSTSPSAVGCAGPDGHRGAGRGVAMAAPLQHDGTALRRVHFPHRRGHVVHGESPPIARPRSSSPLVTTNASPSHRPSFPCQSIAVLLP